MPPANLAPVILPLAEATDIALCGGKAVHLGAAIRAGFEVPPGLAISAPTAQQISAGDGDTLAALQAAYESTFAGAIAVRSSAADEDSSSASFAGQHATLLNVTGFAAVCAAVGEVWQSAHGAAALAYRRQLGIDGEPNCAVVLQALVEPDCAGVLFTADPMSGADVRVVEAAWGFGEVVVSGLVTPDHVQMDRTGAVVRDLPGIKEHRLGLAAAGGLAECAVAPDLIETRCVNAGQLARLNDLAGRVEAAFGPAQDIEWAFVGEILYLLQTRPITTLSAAPASS